MRSQHGRIFAGAFVQVQSSSRAVSAASARFLSSHAVRRQQAAFETSSPAAPTPGQPPLRLILLGAPGAGKGTQTDSLLRQFHLRSLVVGNLLRDEVARKTAVGVQAAKVMKEGGLLDNETILQVVKPGLQQMTGQGWILDGYPRTAQQALDLADALGEQHESINLVVHLDVPDEVLIDRIENRWVHLPSGRIYNTTYNPPKTPGKDDVTGDDLIKRMDDRVDVFERRLSKFHQENNPIKQFYKARGTLVSLSGRTSAEIYPKLEKVIKERFPHLRTRPMAANTKL